MSAPPPRPGRESGVALLIVLVVLFIVAVLMVDITLTATTARRSAQNASSDFLMDAAIEGHYQVAVAQLLYDQGQNKHDSRNDRMFREEYSTFEAKKAEEEEVPPDEGEEDEAVQVGDSDSVKVTARLEDEERKFNLNLLMHPDAKQREAARERLAVLLDRFREDTPLDITRTQADQLRDLIVAYLERAAPGDGEPGKVPLPKSNPWRLLTPDELRNVEGLRDESHNLEVEGILYDAREPEAVREYMADPDAVDPPESYPGLLRYVTLWSGSAWIGPPAPDTWLKINVNTAEKPVLETLFYRNPQDFPFAQRIVEWRDQSKEGTAVDTSKKPSSDEPLPEYQAFEKLEDLKKVDGLTDEVLQRNGIVAAAVTVASETFSLDFLAEHDGATKQVRYVLRRHKEGVQTLLREERADPRFEAKNEGEGGADQADSGGN